MKVASAPLPPSSSYAPKKISTTLDKSASLQMCNPSMYTTVPKCSLTKLYKYKCSNYKSYITSKFHSLDKKQPAWVYGNWLRGILGGPCQVDFLHNISIQSVFPKTCLYISILAHEKVLRAYIRTQISFMS